MDFSFLFVIIFIIIFTIILSIHIHFEHGALYSIADSFLWSFGIIIFLFIILLGYYGALLLS